MNPRIHITSILVAGIVLINLSGCTKDPPPPVAAITSFSPVIATTNDPVKIIGSNFTGATAVSFGGVAAGSFQVISDSVIFAYVAAGASGSILVTTTGGNNELAGFTFYTPPQYTLTGTTKYAAVSYPQRDSSNMISATFMDTCSVAIKRINQLDSFRLSLYYSYGSRTPYADSPNYVILYGVVNDYKMYLPGQTTRSVKFVANQGVNIYARIVDTSITIPQQAPFEGILITGSGVIKNNKLTLQYFTDYRGSSKTSTFTSQ